MQDLWGEDNRGWCLHWQTSLQVDGRGAQTVIIIIVLQGLAWAWFYVENNTSETDVIGCWQYLSWWQLQALKTQDEGRVKEQLLKMVHSLFLQVFRIYSPLENFHNIFTPGGFSEYIYPWRIFTIYLHLVDQTWTPQAQSML